MEETNDDNSKNINKIWIMSISNTFLKGNRLSMIQVKRRRGEGSMVQESSWGGSKSRGSQGSSSKEEGVICVRHRYVRKDG